MTIRTVHAAGPHIVLVAVLSYGLFAGDHFLVLTRAPDLGGVIGAFVRRASEGRAPTRADAEPERVLSATVPFDPLRLPRVRGIAATAFGFVLTAGALVSGGVAQAVAGMFVARGRVSLRLAMTACLVATFLVRALSHLGGRIAGSRAFSFQLLTSSMRTALFVGAAAIVSSALLRIAALVSLPPYVRAAVVVSIILCILRIGPALTTHRGRRLLISTWRRWTRWEFWPPWIFYPPVCAYLVYLMLKHRSATLFTAANPGILAGGVVGESKFDILQELANAGKCVARSCLIDANLSGAEKVLAARRFMADRELTFPIVLKPNHGQRGSGVMIARSADVLQDALYQSSVDTIVQEYVDGPEFGVFYYRRPSEPQGRIFSVTEKRFPTVVGDGRRTLDALILDDQRAVCAARLYLERHRATLSSVPADGESIVLAELGTHCRGALFLDGGWVVTAALEERFEAIARGFDGFYFGRFDVRVDCGLEAFRSGHGFKIIELNGVTSEATHIYHPGTPLMTAYAVLMRQWRIAFEIGAENQQRGTRPTSVRALFQLLRDYSRAARYHLQERPNPTALAPVGEARP